MLNILVVDDEPKHRRGLSRMLKELRPDYEIHSAMDGKEALESVHAHPIDLVFTDIEMPIMDGLEFMERLIDRGGSESVIIMSAYSHFEYAQKAIRLGASDYLLKPIEEAKVVQLLVKAERKGKTERSATLETLLAKLFEGSPVQEDFFQREKSFAPGMSMFLAAEINLPESSSHMTLVRNSLKERLKRIMEEYGFTFGELKRAAHHWLDELAGQMDNGKQCRNETIIVSCKAYIETHYAEELTLSTLAAKFHFNPSYFCMLFKNHTQTTVNQYILQTRMQQAARMLQQTANKVYEIAANVGYKDVKYFIRLFRKEYGVSPDEYRHITAAR